MLLNTEIWASLLARDLSNAYCYPYSTAYSTMIPSTQLGTVWCPASADNLLALCRLSKLAQELLRSLLREWPAVIRMQSAISSGLPISHLSGRRFQKCQRRHPKDATKGDAQHSSP